VKSDNILGIPSVANKFKL